MKVSKEQISGAVKVNGEAEWLYAVRNLTESMEHTDGATGICVAFLDGVGVGLFIQYDRKEALMAYTEDGNSYRIAEEFWNC